MDRASFWHVHELICSNPIFISAGIRDQRSPKHQLVTYLCRVGCMSAIKTAGVMAVAEGSVYIYMNRVSRALRDNHLAWPGPLRRNFISEQTQTWGFPGCLGSGDGSYVNLNDKPLVNGYAYWCRKKVYAVS